MSIRAIDTHHHHYPPAFLTAVDDVLRRTTHAHYERIKRWRPPEAIEAMERSGIEIAVLSIATPSVWLGSTEPSRALARACNEFAAKMQSDYKGRFGHFACLALPDVEGSLREIEFAFDVLKADGIAVTSNYEDKHLGDEVFAPVFDELNRRKAAVYVHPTATSFSFTSVRDIPAPILEFPFDTTRSITSLLFSGTLSRCPDIRWIFSHGGGPLGLVAHRLVGLARNHPRLAARLPNGVMTELAKLYVDVVGITSAGAIGAILDVVPASHLLFGTDMPFWRPEEALEALKQIRIPAVDISAVERNNALRLLPGLRRNTAATLA